MKSAIHFQNAIKNVHGVPVFHVQDLLIRDNETLGIYGLPEEYIEVFLNLMTGAFCPEEGSVTILGRDSREVEEESWFEFVENFGIYNPQTSLDEASSIGENVAALYRLRNDSMEEPNLSASVLRLSNLVQLTIADLSKMMAKANPMLRMKTRLARALAYHPSVVVLCNPTKPFVPELSDLFIDLIKRTRRRLKYTLIAFTSDLWFLEQISDRIIFLDPIAGTFIENCLRGWYHKFLPFLKPSTSQLLQLSVDVAHHGRITRAAQQNIGKH